MEFSYYAMVYALDMFMWYMLIFCGVIFLIAGIDELLYDIIYWGNFLFKRLTGKYKLDYFDKLPAIPEKKIAIMVACWHEASVIGAMLKYNMKHIAYTNYDFFVGVYPNDPETIAVVQAVAKQNKNVHCVIGETPGPTRKASNLNTLFNFIINYEKTTQQSYDIFLIHDAEDVIHPLSLSLCNFGLSTGYDMIQIPIFPMSVKHSYFTHWIYNDEFAESHSKDIVVRQLLHGFVPSAGVGTAISRKALQMLSLNYAQEPFNNESLTEDYNVSLRIHLLGLKAKLLLYKTPARYYKKRYEYIATYSLFPVYYRNAIRQRSRWTLGITLQEWSKGGWPGNWMTKYNLFHDRKALFSNFVAGFSYIVFFYWMANYFINIYFNQTPTLILLLNTYPWVKYLIIIVTLLMLERLLQRVIATTRIYGFKAGLLSILRAPYGNLINLHTVFSALYRFFKAKIDKQPISWQKTVNSFPPQLNKK